MIIQPKDTSGVINNVNGTTSKQLGVKVNGLPHLLRIIRDNIYSNKILAPIREYSTNAMDAHIEAGTPTRPIVIKLPNTLNPVFAVRDFGPGMSEERVWDVFANYGESTKRTSNEQVGMLGIGSKSAFAYTDTFTIVNYHNGVKTVFICSVATTETGNLDQVMSEPTSEPNGLEIQIPVKNSDIPHFISYSKSFFELWEVMPVIEGLDTPIEPPAKWYSGNNWFLPKARTTSHVIMGNIAYAINNYSIKYDLCSDIDYDMRNKVNRLISMGLIIKVNIGDVDIASSRESLQYTDKTIVAIIRAAVNAANELTSAIKSHFDSCTTTFAKKCLFRKFNDYNGDLYGLRFITDGLGSDITSGEYMLKGYNGKVAFDSGLASSFYTKTHRGQRRVKEKSIDINYIECREQFKYILHDTDDTKVLNRITALIERDDNVFNRKYSGVYVIRIQDQAKFDDFVKNHNFDIPMTKFSSLPIVKTSVIYPPSSTPSVRSYVYNPKSNKKMLKVNWAKTSSYHYSQSDYFEIGDIATNGTKIPYLLIDRYLIGGRIKSSDYFDVFKKLFDLLNIDLPDVAAIKSNHAHKIDKNEYVPFVDYVKTLLANKNHLDTLANIAMSAQVSRIDKRLDSYMVQALSDCLKDIQDTTSTAHLLLTNLNQYNNTKYREFAGNLDMVADYLSSYVWNSVVEVKQKVTEKLIADTFARYPILTIVDTYSIHNSVKTQKYISDYINFVDANNAVKDADVV